MVPRRASPSLCTTRVRALNLNSACALPTDSHQLECSVQVSGMIYRTCCCPFKRISTRSRRFAMISPRSLLVSVTSSTPMRCVVAWHICGNSRMECTFSHERPRRVRKNQPSRKSQHCVRGGALWSRSLQRHCHARFDSKRRSRLGAAMFKSIRACSHKSF